MTVLVLVLVALVVEFLCEAGLVWLICWGLNVLGIYTICGRSGCVFQLASGDSDLGGWRNP